MLHMMERKSGNGIVVVNRISDSWNYPTHFYIYSQIVKFEKRKNEILNTKKITNQPTHNPPYNEILDNKRHETYETTKIMSTIYY